MYKTAQIDPDQLSPKLREIWQEFKAGTADFDPDIYDGLPEAREQDELLYEKIQAYLEKKAAKQDDPAPAAKADRPKKPKQEKPDKPAGNPVPTVVTYQTMKPYVRDWQYLAPGIYFVPQDDDFEVMYREGETVSGKGGKDTLLAIRRNLYVASPEVMAALKTLATRRESLEAEVTKLEASVTKARTERDEAREKASSKPAPAKPDPKPEAKTKTEPKPAARKQTDPPTNDVSGFDRIDRPRVNLSPKQAKAVAQLIDDYRDGETGIKIEQVGFVKGEKDAVAFLYNTRDPLFPRLKVNITEDGKVGKRYRRRLRAARVALGKGSFRKLYAPAPEDVDACAMAARMLFTNEGEASKIGRKLHDCGDITEVARRRGSLYKLSKERYNLLKSEGMAYHKKSNPGGITYSEVLSFTAGQFLSDEMERVNFTARELQQAIG